MRTDVRIIQDDQGMHRRSLRSCIRATSGSRSRLQARKRKRKTNTHRIKKEYMKAVWSEEQRRKKKMPLSLLAQRRILLNASSSSFCMERPLPLTRRSTVHGAGEQFYTSCAERKGKGSTTYQRRTFRLKLRFFQKVACLAAVRFRGAYGSCLPQGSAVSMLPTAPPHKEVCSAQRERRLRGVC